jgi:hypothetical protein
MTITRVPRRLRTAAAIVAVLAVLGASTSVALSKGLSSLPFDDGFAEIVVIVSDLDTRVAQLIAATGWREEGRGEVDPAVLARWGLPRTATAREAAGRARHGARSCAPRRDPGGGCRSANPFIGDAVGERRVGGRQRPCSQYF